MSFWLRVQRYEIRTKQAEGLSSNEIRAYPKYGICQNEIKMIFCNSMNLFRHYIVHRLFSVFMALHILNLSVDTSASFVFASDDVALNKIHSLIEFVLEDVFDIHDAVPENSNHHDTAELLETYDDCIAVQYSISFTRHDHLFSRLSFAPSLCFFMQPTLDVTSPPPKA